MKMLRTAWLIVLACFLLPTFAHNINVQVWLPPAPLSERDSTAWETLQALANFHQFTVDSSSQAASLEMSNLQSKQVVLFLNRNGADLSPTQRADLEAFVANGGGFVGIHEGILADASWTAFDSLIGASVAGPLPNQTFTILNHDKAHPATHDLPYRKSWTSPWYNFNAGPREQAHVLLSLRYVPNSNQGPEHPVSWAKQYGRGRSFATMLGAASQDYENGYLQTHLLHAIEWAGGAMAGDARVSDYRSFDLTVLVDNIEGCMAIDVASDGRVFYAEKKGRIYRWDPTDQSKKLLLDWSNTGPDHRVYFPFENGLIGMALAPDFPQTPFIYVHYSYTGSNPWGPGTGQQRVSRLRVIGDSIDASSEEVLIEYNFDRDAQIHSGGCLAFDPDGNLLIATGDNTSYGVGATKNPFNPADPRPGNEIYDAQRTSANTADHRGKVLRIRPSANLGGGYTFPAGNLFPDTDSTLGEIYLMGVRNPFKICVDPATGWLAWGDVGPDATGYDSLRGPMGRDEYNLAKQAGNYGWPYLLADNRPYREFDYDTETSGAWFDPNNLQNRSPNNTGKVNLPPAKGSFLWMDKVLFTPEWLEFGKGNITAMAGAFYRYDSTIADPNKLPEFYDGTLFVMDWTRNWIKAVILDSAGEVVRITPFLDSLKFLGPMDLKVGPDGALYLMEWRTDKWGGTTSRIVRIRYAPDGRSPIAAIETDIDHGIAPLAVQFSGMDSFDPDRLPLTYSWDFGDGSPGTTGPSVSHTFQQTGVFTVTLEVENSQGKTAQASTTVTVGNTRPVVDIFYPLHGGLFGWNEQIDFLYRIRDAEDGITNPFGTSRTGIDCDETVAQVLLGHDAHAHPSVPFTDCVGSFVASPEGHVTYEDELYLLFEVQYTDSSPPGSGRLTGTGLHLLQPKQKQAEHFSFAEGLSRVPTLDSLSLQDIAIEADTAWFAIEPLNLYQINTFQLRLSGTGGKVELWKGDPEGQGLLVMRADLPVTTADSHFVTTAPINFVDPGGTDTYFFRFLADNRGRVSRVNWIQFEGAGVSVANEGLLEETISQGEAPLTWTAFPNPSQDLLTLMVRGQTGPVIVTLLDGQGRELRRQTGLLQPGEPWQPSFSLKGLPSGLYFVRVQQGQFAGYSKIVKQ